MSCAGEDYAEGEGEDRRAAHVKVRKRYVLCDFIHQPNSVTTKVINCT